jgi:exodeoxyribonuclease VII small subunit
MLVALNMAKTTQKLSEHSFESAIERLEQIVEEMEGDRLPLEELLGRYEEGTRLVKVCQERIGAAEKRIELIARSASGEAQLTEYDAASAPESAVSAAPQQPSATASVSARGARRGDSEEVSLF